MLKAIAVSIVIAGLGAAAGAQAGGDGDQVDFSDGWHMHPSTCMVHHQDESEWILGLRHTGMSIDFDVSSQSLSGLEHGGRVELERVLDGASRPIADAGTFNPGDGWQGYIFSEDAEMFTTWRDAHKLELRRGSRVLFQLDLAGIAPAIEASQACYSSLVYGPMDGDNSIEENAM